MNCGFRPIADKAKWDDDISAILVLPGNPDGIGGLEDLLEEGHRVLLVNGAGQNGLWEDMAGRRGIIEKVRATLEHRRLRRTERRRHGLHNPATGPLRGRSRA